MRTRHLGNIFRPAVVPGTPTITTIGTVAGAAAASKSITVPVGGVPAGSLIIVLCGDLSTTILPSCVDTAGNSYTLKNFSPSQSLCLFYAWNSLALVSGNTITLSTGGVADVTQVSAAFGSGIVTASDPWDTAVFATNSGTSTTPTVTSGTPSQIHDLMIGGLNWHGGSTTATQDATHGWAAPPNAPGNPGNPGILGGSQVNAGTGTKIWAPTLAAGVSWEVLVAGFKAA